LKILIKSSVEQFEAEVVVLLPVYDESIPDLYEERSIAYLKGKEG
jgi:hypothetical protein